MKKTIIGKSKNRRLRVESFISSDDQLCFFVTTKRLSGSWKERRIIETKTFYGLYTIRLLYEMLKLFFQNDDFNKKTAKYYGELKENIMNLTTDLK